MKAVHLLLLVLLVGVGCSSLPNFGSRCSEQPDSEYKLRHIEHHNRDSTSVRGKVVDIQNGEPIPGASITVESHAEENFSRRVAETDSTGKFEFELQPGDYTITARFVGYGAGKTRRISLTDGSTYYLKYELECLILREHSQRQRSHNTCCT